MQRALSIGLLVLVALLAGLVVGRPAVLARSPGDARMQTADPLALSGGFVGPCVVDLVVDGDTLAVNCGDASGQVGLAGSDAPEAGERGFAEAGHALRELIRVGEVWLSLHTSLGTVGEARARVYAMDGRELNAEMIRLGWSVYELRQVPVGSARDLEQAEIEARVNRRGLWAPDSP